MVGEDIREKIDKNNREIEQLLDPTKFVLNSAVRSLLEENLRLQSECPHNFRNGVCIYCDKEEIKCE